MYETCGWLRALKMFHGAFEQLNLQWQTSFLDNPNKKRLVRNENIFDAFQRGSTCYSTVETVRRIVFFKRKSLIVRVHIYKKEVALNSTYVCTHLR